MLSKMVTPIKQHGLAYKQGLSRPFPIWTIELEIDTIKSIVTHFLPGMDEFPDFSVKYFNGGVFNKLYEISSNTIFDLASHRAQLIPKKYLFRVSLPINPFFKVESEVATMTYVSIHTEIPVPKVIAYNSNADNSLGFEWILMEMLPGVAMATEWDNWSWETKVEMTKKMTEPFAELHGCFQSNLMGSLYFQGRESPEAAEASAHAFGVTSFGLRLPPTTTPFIVGRSTLPIFHKEKRVHIPANRGPFETLHEFWMSAIDLTIARVESALLDHDPDSLYPPNIFTETDNMIVSRQPYEVLKFLAEAKEMLKHLGFKAGQPELFPARLHHADLHQNNILVRGNYDNLEYEVTGLLDWETVSLVPTAIWNFCGPKFLEMKSPVGRVEDEVTREQLDEMDPESEEYAAASFELEKREFYDLRRLFDRTIVKEWIGHGLLDEISTPGSFDVCYLRGLICEAVENILEYDDEVLKTCIWRVRDEFRQWKEKTEKGSSHEFAPFNKGDVFCENPAVAKIVTDGGISSNDHRETASDNVEALAKDFTSLNLHTGQGPVKSP